MEHYIGVKQLKAIPMNRLAYVQYRGWELPSDENGEDNGFLVEYTDGGKSNHPNHEGYVSWSPADVFEKAYRKTSGLTFGLAIEALKLGKKVSREGWNGKGLFVFKQVPANIGLDIIPKMTSVPQSVKDTMLERGQHLNYRNQCVIVNSQGDVDNWAPSISDVFAEDWTILN
jgi:hypothetical protein